MSAFVHDLDRGRPRRGPDPTHERTHPGRLPTTSSRVISDHPRHRSHHEPPSQSNIATPDPARSAAAIQLRSEPERRDHESLEEESWKSTILSSPPARRPKATTTTSSCRR